MKRKQKFTIILFFSTISVPLIALYILSILSFYINPELLEYISILQFLFVPTFILLCISTIFWIIIKSKKLVFLSILLIFIGTPFMFNYFQLNRVQNLEGLKIMTWNVRSFDFYDWDSAKDTRSKMFELIKKENTDVICFQEFFNSDSINNIKKINSLGYPYIYFKDVISRKRNSMKWGLAIASKYKILDTFSINLNSSLNSCIGVKVIWENRPITIYNSHFQSLNLGYDDYNYINQIIDNYNYDSKKTNNILSKINKATIKRKIQTQKVADIINSNKNQILCTDLNDIANSYSYNLLTKNLIDSYSKKGNGFSISFNALFSLFRIDYIFVSKDFQINSYKNIRKYLSDHNPIVITLQ